MAYISCRFYWYTFCRLLFCAYFRFDSGNGEKNGKDNWDENQRVQSKDGNDTGGAGRGTVYYEINGVGL